MKPESSRNQAIKHTGFVKSLWKRKLKHCFNVLSVGQIFRSSGNRLVVGHEDGVVRVYELPQVTPESTDEDTDAVFESSESLETKGGPIQSLVIHNVTKLNNNDVTVADSRGMVTVFSCGQILARQSVSEHCIQCLKIQQSPLGRNAIVAGDQQGHVTAFSPFAELWRIRLSDSGKLKAKSQSPRVMCVHVAELTDSSGQKGSYILVSDSCRNVHLLQGGDIVMSLSVPAVVTAMISGKFVDSEDIELGCHGNAKSVDVQVAMGTDTGAVYLFANFQLYPEEIANIQQTITLLERLPAADTQTTDTLLCAGHFDALYLIHRDQLPQRHQMPGWISSLATADINNDNIKEVVVGCHDNSIHGLQIQIS